jgi:hypothetical protein
MKTYGIFPQRSRPDPRSSFINRRRRQLLHSMSSDLSDQIPKWVEHFVATTTRQLDGSYHRLCPDRSQRHLRVRWTVLPYVAIFFCLSLYNAQDLIQAYSPAARGSPSPTRVQRAAVLVCRACLCCEYAQGPFFSSMWGSLSDLI